MSRLKRARWRRGRRTTRIVATLTCLAATIGLVAPAPHARVAEHSVAGRRVAAGSHLGQMAPGPVAAAVAPAAPLSTPTASTAPVPTIGVFGPGGGEYPLVNLINAAQRRILVEAFELGDSAVIGALAAAVRRGVDVRVMLDPNGLNSTGAIYTLRGAGIRTHVPYSGGQNPAYAVTHQETVVVDASAVAVSTAGLTTDGLGPSGGGYLVIDRDPLDVLQAASIFYDDWLRRPITLFGHNLLILPDNSARIAALIGQASARVELYTAGALDPGIVAALRAARLRGAVVRVLARTGGDLSALQSLALDTTIRLRDNGPGTILVIDRRLVLLGSMDLTTVTLASHREVGVVFGGPAIVATIDATFFTAFTQGVVVAPPLAPPTRRARTVTVGRLSVTTDVPSYVRPGSQSTIVITSAPGVTLTLTISYPGPGGQLPPGGAGYTGVTDRQGSFTYAWSVPSGIPSGQALIRVVARRSGTVLRSYADVPVIH